MESWCHVVWHYGTPIIPNRSFGFHPQLPLDKKWPMKSIPPPLRNTRWLLDCLIAWLIVWLIEWFGRASHSEINTIKHSSNNSSIYTLTHFINLFQRSCSLYYFFSAELLTLLLLFSGVRGLWLAASGSQPSAQASCSQASSFIRSLFDRFPFLFRFRKGKMRETYRKTIW